MVALGPLAQRESPHVLVGALDQTTAAPGISPGSFGPQAPRFRATRLTPAYPQVST